MSKFDKLQGRVVLQDTQKVHHEDLDTEEQRCLAEWYKDAKVHGTAMASYIVSIVNMVLTQKRIHFCITRRATGLGIRNDKNTGTGFSDRHYTTLHNKLIKDMKLFQVVKQGSGRMPTHYKLIDPDLRKMLQVDENEQIEEVTEFLTQLEHKKEDGTANGTANGTKGGSTSGWKDESVVVLETKKNTSSEPSGTEKPIPDLNRTEAHVPPPPAFRFGDIVSDPWESLREQIEVTLYSTFLQDELVSVMNKHFVWCKADKVMSEFKAWLNPILDGRFTQSQKHEDFRNNGRYHKVAFAKIMNSYTQILKGTDTGKIVAEEYR